MSISYHLVVIMTLKKFLLLLFLDPPRSHSLTVIVQRFTRKQGSGQKVIQLQLMKRGKIKVIELMYRCEYGIGINLSTVQIRRYEYAIWTTSHFIKCN